MHFKQRDVPFFDKSRCSSNALPYANTQDCINNVGEYERSCDGNGCCRASLPDDTDAHQVIGLRLESFDDDDGNSTNRKCRVAFLTDEVYMSSNVTEPEIFFAKEYATVSIGWVIQTKNLPFLDSLSCKNSKEYRSLEYRYQSRISCVCNNITISGTNYANCGCNQGYTGNPYLSNGCEG